MQRQRLYCGISCTEYKNADVTAVEISDKAAEYIKKNAELNNTDLNIVKDDVLSEKTAEIFSGIDAIVCNPPYLTADDMKSLQKEVTFEPETALFGGKDGLDFYRNITKLWKDCLKSGGILAYEIGMGQEDAVMKILEENNFINIEMTEDLSGIIRVVRGEKNLTEEYKMAKSDLKKKSKSDSCSSN